MTAWGCNQPNPEHENSHTANDIIQFKKGGGVGSVIDSKT